MYSKVTVAASSNLPDQLRKTDDQQTDALSNASQQRFSLSPNLLISVK